MVCSLQDSAQPRTMPGSTSFAASSLLSALAGVEGGAPGRDNDKSINAKEFLMLLQDLGLLDGSLSVRDGVKVRGGGGSSAALCACRACLCVLVGRHRG
jgi:hypothetical protein